MYRIRKKLPELFLIHMGGPFWKDRDAGAWSIPKGEYGEEEQPLAAARREFEEETGYKVNGDFIELKPIQQKGGKLVQAWAVEGNVDADHIVSNHFTIEWPYRSGRYQSFPEADRAAWFDPATAEQKIIPGQVPLIHELLDLLKKK